MGTFTKVFLSSLFCLSPLFLSHGYAEEEAVIAVKPFDAFTGKITKNKVRLRQNPSLESPVIRELKKEDLLVVVGETDEFYVVQPPADLKVFVFRTYILDNVVEANRVNVRLEPNVDAPSVAQLSAGERINGEISSRNNKWLEITPPKSVKFYISKDYVTKIGDATLIVTLEKRRDEVNLLLNSTDLASQSEMQKSFPEINLESALANYHKIVTSYADFPEQTARAQERIKALQESYLQKKLSFLEAKTKMANADWQSKNIELNDQVKSQQQKLNQLEQQLQKGQKTVNIRDTFPNGLNNKMAAWLPVEKELFEAWRQQDSSITLEAFYKAQADSAVVVTGVLEPYTRVIRNKPGDYIVVDSATNLPIAFVYSTTIDLNDKVGQHVNLHAAPRSNNNFAYPAYFVLSAD